jgi:hypothetical protein
MTCHDGTPRIFRDFEVGRLIPFVVVVFTRSSCVYSLCTSVFSMMIERVPEWSSPHIAKCGFVVPKGTMSWILAAANNYTR